MKTLQRPVIALTAALLLSTCAFAQGALTPPPGAPAPTMKSLAELDARTPIGAVGGSTSTIMISTPGSYVLLGNVNVAASHGIVISASNVTLDLNGFTLSKASAASGSAVFVNGAQSNLVIRNGQIDGSFRFDPNTGTSSGSGFDNGIIGFEIVNSRVSNLSIRGVSGHGVYLDSGSTIEHCVAESCGRTGLIAPIVSTSSAINCGKGIQGQTVSDCHAITYDKAIEASQCATNCTGTGTVGPGINSTSGSVLNCQGTSTTSDGIWAINASNCTGRSVSRIGVNVTGSATGCYGKTTGGYCGVQAPVASFCRGSGPNAIVADIAVACTAEAGLIYANKQLGTP